MIYPGWVKRIPGWELVHRVTLPVWREDFAGIGEPTALQGSHLFRPRTCLAGRQAEVRDYNIWSRL
jgi:hypothetical protein